MRTIRNGCLGEMRSPIVHLMKTLHHAVVKIAPEREREFDSTYEDFTLEYVDSPKFDCFVDTQTRHLRLSRRAVEIVWCASYARLIFYQKEIQGKRVLVPCEIDLRRDPEISSAMRLLQWTYTTPSGIYLTCP